MGHIARIEHVEQNAEIDELNKNERTGQIQQIK